MESNFLPLTEAVAAATGQQVKHETIYRWTQFGLDGIRLKSWKIGRRRFTTVAAVKEWIEARSNNDPETERATPKKAMSYAESVKILDEYLPRRGN